MLFDFHGTNHLLFQQNGISCGEASISSRKPSSPVSAACTMSSSFEPNLKEDYIRRIFFSQAVQVS
jgi:hypothetical protein